MALREIRCGSSNAVYRAPRIPRPRKDDHPAPRLLIPLHFAKPSAGGFGFRLVARLGDGTHALLCLGATREEVARRAWTLLRELPAGTVKLHLQEWVGGVCSGRWLRLPSRAGELPRLQRRLPRRSGRWAEYKGVMEFSGEGAAVSRIPDRR
jgi:hypothetical protein